MSYVVIVEPDEIHAASIRAILDGVETNFEYSLVSTAERAITLVEERETDVFIGEMQMPVMSGEEMFSLIKLMSPDTLQIVMTDGKKLSETVSFVNECKVFKIIITPCRLAEDLLVPINAALAHKAHIQAESKKMEQAETSIKNLKAAYDKERSAWNDTVRSYAQAKGLLTDMLKFNIDQSNCSADTKARLGEWYGWIVEQYIKTNLEEADDSYVDVAQRLTAYGNDSMNGQTFQMKNNCKEAIAPRQLSEMAFIVTVYVGYFRAVLKRYDIKVLIEDAGKAYILRIRCSLFRDWTKGDKQVLYRERDEEMRNCLSAATERAIDAFGFKSVTMEKGDDYLINIAVHKKYIAG